LRLIGKCLHVGVMEGAEFTRPEIGTAQSIRQRNRLPRGSGLVAKNARRRDRQIITNHHAIERFLRRGPSGHAGQGVTVVRDIP